MDERPKSRRPAATDSAGERPTDEESERPTTSGLCPRPSHSDGEESTANSSSDTDFHPEESLNSDSVAMIDKNSENSTSHRHVGLDD